MFHKKKVVIIAEAGVNHNGSLRRALAMVDVAAKVGADVIKFQTFNAKQVVSRYAPKAEYQMRNTNAVESQLEMALKLELNAESHSKLKQRCEKRGIGFLSSPFDIQSLEFLANKLKIECIKVGSGEITNFPFLLAVAHCGRAIILSTGMSTLSEIKNALGVIAYGFTSVGTPEVHSDAVQIAYESKDGQRALGEYVSLLHCVTEYPADVADVNLKAMDTMREYFNLPVGLSDHTLGTAISIGAVARGASIIEKHFTLDKNLAGPDHVASLDPEELATMVSSVRAVEQALGDGTKQPADSEKKNLVIARRSLTASRAIAKGEILTPENLTTKRPGNGVSAINYWDYLGVSSNRDYQEDEKIDNLYPTNRLE